MSLRDKCLAEFSLALPPVPAEKEAEFLIIFDRPGVAKCYKLKPGVVPRQAPAMTNCGIALAQARVLAGKLDCEAGEDADRFSIKKTTRILRCGLVSKQFSRNYTTTVLPGIGNG